MRLEILAACPIKYGGFLPRCHHETLLKRTPCYARSVEREQRPPDGSEDSLLKQTHLFTLRMWAEKIDAGQDEWRGALRHVSSGEIRYFRDVATLYRALRTMLDDEGSLA